MLYSRLKERRWPGDETLARARGMVLLAALLPAVASAGCMQSLYNSWLEPSAVGHFSREGTTEIRGSLSIQDSPLGIPGATEPVPEDLEPMAEEYRIGAGDALVVRIMDLFARGAEAPSQVLVDSVGSIRLPIVGRLTAAGLTAAELEEEIADYLAQQDVLEDAQVIVEPMVRRGATFTVFGSISGPNVYPLPTPDFTILEAVNMAGGLHDTARDIYVFRQEKVGPDAMPETAVPPLDGGVTESRPAPVYLSSAAGLGRPLAAHRAERAPAGQAADPLDPIPPEDDEEARRQIVEAIAPARSQPARVGEGERESQPAEEPPPVQSRWIFLNGNWIEIQPEPQRPSSAPGEGPPGAVPEQGPELPSLPTPTIDWTELVQEERHRIIHISAEALRDGDPRQNIIVRAGDTIRLTAGQAGEYYMMGQINRPGAYSLSGRSLTLKVAIAAAGNLSPLAWPERCTVYRRLGDREEMIQVNVDRLFAGKDPDFYVKKDDLIVFGTHPASLFLAVLRSAFRLTYGFGFVYDRNFADVDNIRRSVAASVKAQQAAQPRFPGLFP